MRKSYRTGHLNQAHYSKHLRRKITMPSLSDLKTATRWDKRQPVTGFDGDEPNTVEWLESNIESLMNGYGKFLNDGDYEEFMPYTNKGQPINLKLLQWVEQQLARLYWIKNRFTAYGSKEWKLLEAAHVVALNRMDLIQNQRKYFNYQNFFYKEKYP